jgi:cobalamin-dependent methionine synthase I
MQAENTKKGWLKDITICAGKATATASSVERGSSWAHTLTHHYVENATSVIKVMACLVLAYGRASSSHIPTQRQQYEEMMKIKHQMRELEKMKNMQAFEKKLMDPKLWEEIIKEKK